MSIYSNIIGFKCVYLSRYSSKGVKNVNSRRTSATGYDKRSISVTALFRRTKAHSRLNRDRKISLTEFRRIRQNLTSGATRRGDQPVAFSVFPARTPSFDPFRVSLETKSRGDNAPVSSRSAALVSAAACVARARHENQYPFPFGTSYRPYRGVFRSTVLQQTVVRPFSEGLSRDRRSVTEDRFLPITHIR